MRQIPINPDGPLTAQLRPHGLHEHCARGDELVYRFRNQGGALLYVGVTVNPIIRWQAHRTNAAWWSLVACVDITHVEHGLGLLLELHEIKTRFPIYNVRGRSDSGSPSRNAAGAARAPFPGGMEGIGREWNRDVVPIHSYVSSGPLSVPIGAPRPTKPATMDEPLRGSDR